MVTGFSFKAKVRALVPGARFKINIRNRSGRKITLPGFFHVPFLGSAHCGGFYTRKLFVF